MKNETLTPGEMPLPLLRYDGKMGEFLHQFSEYDTAVASYGSSFYLSTVDFTTEKLVAKRAAKLEEFSRCALL